MKTLGTLLSLAVFVAVFSACATTDVLTGLPLPSPGTTGQSTDIDPLIQLANNPLIAAVLDDAAATQTWVDVQEKAGMDPIKVTLARACPTAAKFAAVDFHDKVLALKSALDGVGQQIEAIDLSKPQPRVILRLTQLKYGTGLDIQTQIAEIKADINLRLDALTTGCLHLFPKKQLNALAGLALKAGLISTGGGGVLAMFLP